MADSTTSSGNRDEAAEKVTLDKTDQDLTGAADGAGTTTEDEPKRRRRRGAAAAGGAAPATKEKARSKAGDKAGRGSRSGKGSGKTDPAGRLPVGRIAQVITALLVIGVLLGVILLVQLLKGPGKSSKLEAQENRREAARQIADGAVPRLFSFDYRQLDKDFAAQRALSTGAFTAQLDTQTGPAVRSLGTKNHVVVQGVSLGSAVLEDNGTDVQVLVFLNQAVTSNLLAAPRLDRNRVVATMRLVDGQWKVADIKAL